jgi:hypothetical protein
MTAGVLQRLPLVAVVLLGLVAWHAAGSGDAAVQHLKQQQQLKYQQAIDLRWAQVPAVHAMASGDICYQHTSHKLTQQELTPSALPATESAGANGGHPLEM